MKTLWHRESALADGLPSVDSIMRRKAKVTVWLTRYTCRGFSYLGPLILVAFYCSSFLGFVSLSKLFHGVPKWCSIYRAAHRRSSDEDRMALLSELSRRETFPVTLRLQVGVLELGKEIIKQGIMEGLWLQFLSEVNNKNSWKVLKGNSSCWFVGFWPVLSFGISPV